MEPFEWLTPVVRSTPPCPSALRGAITFPLFDLETVPFIWALAAQPLFDFMLSRSLCSALLVLILLYALAG
jgi:hypothetical protein